MKRFLTLVATAVALAAPAIAAAQQPSVDPNYAIALEVVQNVQVANALAAKAKADAMPKAIAGCAAFAGELAQSICVLAVTGNLGGGETQARMIPAGATIPAPPAPPKAAASIYELLANAGPALFEGAVRIAPSVVQFLLGKANARAQVEMAVVGSQERQTLYTTLGSMNATSVAAVRDAAAQGFITLGTMPPTYQVSGAGNNFGPGALTYNPVTNSYNPVNPAPRVCHATETGVVCQ